MLMVRCTAVIVLSLALSPAARSDSWPPPAGVDVDAERTFTLPTRAPEPCLSATVDGVSFLLPREELKRMTTAAGPAGTEAYEQALGDAQRAKRFLALETAKEMDRYGCVPLAKPLKSDPYLVLHLLEAGKAAVAVAGKLNPQVIVRYMGSRCGPGCGHGEMLVYLPEGRRLLLSLFWWVA